MRHALRAAGLVLVVTAFGTAGAAAQARTARVTYLTTELVFVDAGRLDGLGDSSQVEVVRGGATIAVLRVAFLASHQASCRVVSATTPIVVGDSARFVPLAPNRVDSAVAATLRPVPRVPARGGMHGRLGLEYFHLGQRDSLGTRLSQPSVDVRLDGPLATPNLWLTLDVRARRTFTILPDGRAVTDGRSRVYQGAVTLGGPRTPVRFTVGRQLSPNLASVGLFDGILLSSTGKRWSAGAFTGSQPEPLHLGYSNEIMQGGAYIQGHSRAGSTTPWAVTLGASGSYQNSHTNREFAYLQANVASRRLSLFATQEVDYYRPWKLQPGMRPFSPTSTFIAMQLRPVRAIVLDAGFDNRRNVLLYRDVVNPETVFDDTYRQGRWGGIAVQPAPYVRLGVDARISSGGSTGRADAYTATLGIDRLTPLHVSVRTRSTRYLNPDFNGWLNSATLTFEPRSLFRFEVNGGQRAERGPVIGSRSVRWVGTGLDVTVGRAWYLMFSATWQRGALEAQDQLYAGASFRF